MPQNDIRPAWGRGCTSLLFIEATQHHLKATQKNSYASRKLELHACISSFCLKNNLFRFYISVDLKGFPSQDLNISACCTLSMNNWLCWHWTHCVSRHPRDISFHNMMRVDSQCMWDLCCVEVSCSEVEGQHTGCLESIQGYYHSQQTDR